MGRNTSFLNCRPKPIPFQDQTVVRTRILFLKADGISIDETANKVGINRKSVMLCIRDKHISQNTMNS